MPVYRSSISADPVFTEASSFFSTLIGCLNGICKAGVIRTIELSPQVNPVTPENLSHFHHVHHWERDLMLLRGDVPLLALYLRYSPSKGPRNVVDGATTEEEGYADAPSYGGLAGASADLPPPAANASLEALKSKLEDCMRAGLPVVPKTDPPKPSFGEGVWTMIIRVPGMKSVEVFHGEPMDVDGIDGAFTRLVDLLVARSPKA